MAQGELMVEKNPLKANQLCIAIDNFTGQEDGDLPFSTGEKIRIINPCNLMFWYEAQNENGKTGMVPSNFLRPLDSVSESTYQQGFPAAAGSKGQVKLDGGYLQMNPQDVEQAKKQGLEIQLAQEKELHRRLKAGTLVVATCPFRGQQDSDMSFDTYEEMMILKPLPDLCWYHAQKTEQPSENGSIPVTHVRLVYMSDDETDPALKYSSDSSHERLYDDANDFISMSGWFSFPSLPHCKEALQHVLAKKCRMSYEDFLACKEAVYCLDYTNGEKKFVGKACVLHKELCAHFDHYEKKRDQIREIDDELCHHTSIAGWEITVWPMQEGMDLEVECAKKLIELDALVSKDGVGITEKMDFTSRVSFDKFWDWFSPPLS